MADKQSLLTRPAIRSMGELAEALRLGEQLTPEEQTSLDALRKASRRFRPTKTAEEGSPSGTDTVVQLPRVVELGPQTLRALEVAFERAVENALAEREQRTAGGTATAAGKDAATAGGRRRSEAS